MRLKKYKGRDFSRTTTPLPKKKLTLLNFETFGEALHQREKIKQAAAGCDQLNIVIKQEGNMDDLELLGIDPKVKIYAGAAWTLIHERRVAEEWYKA